MDKLWTTLRHNQTLVVSVLICLALLVWGYGCKITTDSPLGTGQQVTRNQLDAQVESYVSQVTSAYDDLATKEAIRALVFNSVVAYAQGDGINPIGVVTSLAGILGIGAVVDNRRKDAVIKSKSNALASIDNTKKE